MPVVLACVWSLSCLTVAEQPDSTSLRPDFAAIARDLAADPPALNQPVRNRPVRDDALTRFDAIICTEFANNFQFVETRPASLDALQAFYKYQIANAVNEMQSSDYAGDVRFWNIYNCGFVVRDGDILFSFDLVPLMPLHEEPFPEWNWLLDNLDVAFYSHSDGDHYLPEVAKRIAANGHARVITWENTAPGPHTVGTLRYHIHPGAQGDAPNNNYEVVTPSGVVLYHMGDQSWAKHVKNSEPRIDVLFAGYDLFDFRLTPRPRAVVPMHMFELQHSGGGRLTRYEPTPHFYQFINWYDNIMIWGEGVTVEPDKIPPVHVGTDKPTTVPVPDCIADARLRDLFRKMPDEYARISAELLRHPPVIDPKAPYQHERAAALDGFDRIVTKRLPDVVERDTCPTAAEFEGLRRCYAFWMAKAVDEILNSSTVAGVRFWQFYRGGWVVTEGDFLFGVNLMFPEYLNPMDTPAPRDALMNELRALFVSTGFDVDWAAGQIAEDNPKLTLVNMPAEKTSGDIDGLKWTAYPGRHQIACPIEYPNTQYAITTPRGVTLYFPGDQTDVADFPRLADPFDIAFVSYHHFSIIPNHPLALSPTPRISVPDHLYDFFASPYTQRMDRHAPRWHAEELDAIWHHQLFWGESFTYQKKITK